MDTKKETISYYRAKLPDRVKVKIHQETDGSFWAKLLDFPGASTQGNDFSDLMMMITEAIYIVNDIPAEYFGFMPRYSPSEIREQLERKKLQDQFNEFIARQINGTRELEFTK